MPKSGGYGGPPDDPQELSVEQLKSLIAVKEAEADEQPKSLAQRLHAQMRAKGLNPGTAATKSLYELAELVEKSQKEQREYIGQKLLKVLEALQPAFEDLETRIKALETRE